ncbi:MAG: lycopene cyclase domain-containing protein [Syntrophomonadaceae bacterium]
MYTYLIINTCIIIFPLIMSFEQKVRYYRKFPRLFLSILIAAVPYIIWDSYAAIRSDWMFNIKYILGIRVFSLPVEEILFFITVPFSSIFIYESLRVYIPEKTLKLNSKVYFAAGIAIVLISFIFIDRYYTFTVLLFTGAFLMISSILFVEIINSKIFWIFNGVMYIPFLIFNYILTSLPVVIYSGKAVTGVRFLTIPAEDFLYSFTLLSFYLSVYSLLGNKWRVKIK